MRCFPRTCCCALFCYSLLLVIVQSVSLAAHLSLGKMQVHFFRASVLQISKLYFLFMHLQAHEAGGHNYL